jgi:hypothetical protein
MPRAAVEIAAFALGSKVSQTTEELIAKTT